MMGSSVVLNDLALDEALFLLNTRWVLTSGRMQRGNLMTIVVMRSGTTPSDSVYSCDVTSYPSGTVSAMSRTEYPCRSGSVNVALMVLPPHAVSTSSIAIDSQSGSMIDVLPEPRSSSSCLMSLKLWILWSSVKVNRLP